MTTEELLSKLRAEVERIRKSYDVYLARITKEDVLTDLDDFLYFLDTLEKEDKYRLDMEHEIELQIMPSGNVAVYRGNGFIPTEQLTQEEKEFIIDRIAEELGVNTKGDRETFAEHYGCLPDPPQEPTPVTVTAEKCVEDFSLTSVETNSFPKD